jgi:glycosyltransferase involved in cell wall biosynthesis
MSSVLGFLDTSSSWDKMKATTYYRLYLPLRELNRNAPDFSATILSQEMIGGKSDTELAGFDLYCMSRMYGEGSKEFARAVHQAGGRWVFDTDDDLSENTRMLMGYGEQFKAALGEADFVTVSTGALAHHLAQYCQRPPIVLRNHIDYDWFTGVAGQVRKVLPGVVVGLSGSSSHYWDWRIATDALSLLAADYPGITPAIHSDFVPYYCEDTIERLVSLPKVPYSVYPSLLRQFSIVLCALDTMDKFNDYRSDIKPIEAMVTGAVAVCSRQGEYVALAEAGAPILLVEEETKDCWYETTRQLIDDEAMRRDLSARGPEWVRGNRDMVAHGWKLWERAYGDFVD